MCRYLWTHLPMCARSFIPSIAVCMCVCVHTPSFGPKVSQRSGKLRLARLRTHTHTHTHTHTNTHVVSKQLQHTIWRLRVPGARMVCSCLLMFALSMPIVHTHTHTHTQSHLPLRRYNAASYTPAPSSSVPYCPSVKCLPLYITCTTHICPVFLRTCASPLNRL